MYSIGGFFRFGIANCSIRISILYYMTIIVILNVQLVVFLFSFHATMHIISGHRHFWVWSSLSSSSLMHQLRCCWRQRIIYTSAMAVALIHHTPVWKWENITIFWYYHTQNTNKRKTEKAEKQCKWNFHFGIAWNCYLDKHVVRNIGEKWVCAAIQ